MTSCVVRYMFTFVVSSPRRHSSWCLRRFRAGCYWSFVIGHLNPRSMLALLPIGLRPRPMGNFVLDWDCENRRNGAQQKSKFWSRNGAFWALFVINLLERRRRNACSESEGMQHENARLCCRTLHNDASALLVICCHWSVAGWKTAALRASGYAGCPAPPCLVSPSISCLLVCLPGPMVVLVRKCSGGLRMRRFIVRKDQLKKCPIWFKMVLPTRRSKSLSCKRIRGEPARQ